MRRLISFVFLLSCALARMYGALGYEAFQLSIYDDAKEYQQYVGDTLVYCPIGEGMVWSPQFGLNSLYGLRMYVLESVKLLKEKKSWQETQWVVRDVENGERESLLIYLGDYKYNCNPNEESLVKDLQFIELKKWKWQNRIWLGKVYTDSLVKAQYKIVDIVPFMETVEEPWRHSFVRGALVIENSETKKREMWKISEDIASAVFEDDKAGKYEILLKEVRSSDRKVSGEGKMRKSDVDNETSSLRSDIYHYEDNLFKFIMTVYEGYLRFAITDKSNDVYDVVWEKTSFEYVDESVDSLAFVVDGKWEKCKKPTLVSSFAKSQVITFAPLRTLHYDVKSKIWKPTSLCPNEEGKESKMNLKMVLKSKKRTLEYSFKFEIGFVYDHPERLNLPVVVNKSAE